MFPLDHRGEFKRSKTTISNGSGFPQDFLSRASRALQAVGARNIDVRGNRVEFTGGLLRLVWNWNILNQVGYGYIELSEAEDYFVVSYFASFRQMFVLISAMVFLFFGGVLFFNDVEGMSIVEKLALLFLFWLFLFGGNWIIGMIQFPSLVKSMLWGGERI